jgi:hypothetical protein
MYTDAKDTEKRIDAKDMDSEFGIYLFIELIMSGQRSSIRGDKLLMHYSLIAIESVLCCLGSNGQFIKDGGEDCQIYHVLACRENYSNRKSFSFPDNENIPRPKQYEILLLFQTIFGKQQLPDRYQ